MYKKGGSVDPKACQSFSKLFSHVLTNDNLYLLHLHILQRFCLFGARKVSVMFLAVKKVNPDIYVIYKLCFSTHLGVGQRACLYFIHLKAHANGRNIVGKQNAALLGPTCCVRLPGTTTMLALVAYSLKPVKRLGPCKRTQHCWSTTYNNFVTCDLLRPFAWAFRRF